MALLPPDSTGRHEPGKDAAARRQRARFARDVGDEQGQAWAHEPRRKRSKLTLGVAAVFVAFLVLGALPLLLDDGDTGLVKANCDVPAVETGPSRITAGTDFSWQAAGPVIGPYVVALDAGTVTGPPTGPVTVDSGRVLSGPTALSGCRSAQTVTGGPGAKGSHEVALFRRSATGWERVAVAFLDVS